MDTVRNISRKYDIVIVGAGPSGCAIAKNLSKSFKILLLDWSMFPRDKPCGGLLVEESQEAINVFGKAKNIFSHPKHLDMKVFDIDNDFEKTIKRRLSNVYRKSFDYWMLTSSIDDVDFSSQTKLVEFNKGDKFNLILEKNNKKRMIECKYLVGANGALSNIRKHIDGNNIGKYFCIQENIRSNKDIGENFFFIYDKEITDFYSWVIPKGNIILIGSALRKKNLQEKFSLFKKKLREKFEIYGPSSKTEAAVLTRPISINNICFGKENNLLIGEAAGLMSPSTGEGISFAIRSGVLCAKALNEKMDSKRGEALELYMNFSKNLHGEIREKLRKSKILSDPTKRLDYFKK